IIGLGMDIWLQSTAWQPDRLSAKTLLANVLSAWPVAIPVDQVLLLCSTSVTFNHYSSLAGARFSRLVVGN
ncbi:hypothetical protein HOY80DRAFT_893202, partial [Tuber brumale]